jgi:hypothetical protein
MPVRKSLLEFKQLTLGYNAFFHALGFREKSWMVSHPSFKAGKPPGIIAAKLIYENQVASLKAN